MSTKIRLNTEKSLFMIMNKVELITWIFAKFYYAARTIFYCLVVIYLKKKDLNVKHSLVFFPTF